MFSEFCASWASALTTRCEPRVASGSRISRINPEISSTSRRAFSIGPMKSIIGATATILKRVAPTDSVRRLVTTKR